MNQFYTPVKLPSILLDLSILYDSSEIYRNLKLSDINKEVVDVLEQQMLSIYSIEVFKTDLNNKRWVVHVDGPVEGDMAKINWVYENTNCLMKWFKKKPGTSFKTNQTTVGPYLEYNDADVEEIASFNIGSVAVVQTGIPHTVINDSTQPRFCVSINLTHSHVSCVPYDTAVKLLHNFVL